MPSWEIMCLLSEMSLDLMHKYTNIRVHKYCFIVAGVDHSSLNLCSMQTFLSLLLLLVAAIHSVNPDQRVIGLEDNTDYHVIMKSSDAT